MVQNDDAMQVLVVDDEPELRGTLEAAVELAGYRCLTAEHGDDGWAVFQDKLPDLVITDMRMPVSDGLELIARIRQVHDNVHKYVIMMSGDDNPEIRVNALNAGANDFLRKPFSMREFLAKLEVGERTIHATCQLESSMEQFRERIYLDELTGLMKRDAFEERCRQEIARASRYDRQLSCVVVTVQNVPDLESEEHFFSEEECLTKTSRLLRQLVRSSDVLGRYGTHQIGVLLPETGESNAHRVVEKLQTAVSNGAFSSGTRVRPKFEFGVASYQAIDSGMHNLIETAAGGSA